MILIGDIGNTDTKICLVNNNYKIVKRIVLSTHTINKIKLSKDAEDKADQRQMAKAGGIIREDLEDENDEIKKGMMGVNPRMQMG